MPAQKTDHSISSNRNARRDYQILETYEAGVVLCGTEVKSIRAGKANITDAFARIEGGNAILYQCDIAPYDKSHFFNHEPRQPRRLLLHKSEIAKIYSTASVKGHSIPALEMYWKNGRVKIRLGVGQGKTHQDRRQDIKSADAKREIDRAIKNRLNQ